MRTRGKIAVAGGTGRVSRHVVDVLTAEGHDVVAMSRSGGVDVIIGDGLAEALTDVESIIDVATGSSPDREAATQFFMAAARNLRDAGERAGVWRIVVVSIIGIDRFHRGLPGGQDRPRAGHAVGPDPGARAARGAVPRVRRPAGGLGRQGEVSYMPRMRTQLVAARTVAKALADLATESDPAPESSGGPTLEIAGPREESLADMARLLVARRDSLRIEEVSNPVDPDRDLYETDALLPGPDATLAGPTFEELLELTS